MGTPTEELISNYKPIFPVLPGEGQKDPIFGFTIGEFEDIEFSPVTMKEGKRFSIIYDTDLCGSLDKLLVEQITTAPEGGFVQREFEESDIGAFDVTAFIESVMSDIIRIYDLGKAAGFGESFGDYVKLTFYNEYLDFNNEDLRIDIRDRIGYLTSTLGNGRDRTRFVTWVTTKMKDLIFTKWVSHCNKQSEIVPGIVKQIATVKLYMVTVFFTKTIKQEVLNNFLLENSI